MQQPQQVLDEKLRAAPLSHGLHSRVKPPARHKDLRYGGCGTRHKCNLSHSSTG